jgi:hypothetical protein
VLRNLVKEEVMQKQTVFRQRRSPPQQHPKQVVQLITRTDFREDRILILFRLLPHNIYILIQFLVNINTVGQQLGMLQ